MYKYKKIYESLYGKKPKFIEYFIKKNFDYLFKCNILIYKFSTKKNKLIKKYYCSKIYRQYKIIIGCNTKIGKNFIIKHPMGIAIGEGAVIGDNVSIYQNVTIGQKKGKYPKIESNVVIYPNSVVVGDITVSDGSIVGANCYCDKNISGIVSTTRCFNIDNNKKERV